MQKTHKVRLKSGGTLSPEKAKEMLRDGTANGKKLTAKQKRYFGYIAGGGKANNGASITNLSETGDLGDIIQFNGPSHNNGGIPISYGGQQVEVEGNETGYIDPIGNLNIFGNMYVPGTKTKFKVAAEKIAKEESKVARKMNKGMELTSKSDPYDKFEQYTFNSGKLMASNAARQKAELGQEKDFLSNLQNTMLAMGMGESEGKAKYGKTIARNGDEVGPKPKKESLAKRHNNPGNIMYVPGSGYQKRLGVVKGEPRYDNGKLTGYYAKFPSIEAGLEGMKTQLFDSKSYKNLTVDQAAKKWVHGDPNYPDPGYKNIPKSVASKKISDLNDQERKLVFDTFTVGEDSKRYNWEDTGIPKESDTPRTDITVTPYRPSLTTFTAVNPPNNPTKPVETAIPVDDNGTPYDYIVPEETPRPPFRNPLSPGQVAGEFYTLATERPQFVPGQTFEPELFQPYTVSFQDRLNRNNATFRDIIEQVGNNPAALSALGADKYQADNAVIADQFRTNQGISNDITNRNIDLLNNAELTNIQLADQQFVRQSQAQSNTRENIRNAMNSIAGKLEQNRLETRRYNAYSNLFPQYTFDNQGLVEYVPNESQYFSAGGFDPSTNAGSRTRSTYDANGNLKQTVQVNPSAYEIAKQQQQLQEREMKNRWRIANQIVPRKGR